MRYEEVDPVIRDWARKYKLHLYEEHYDEEIRAADINDELGRTYQIGIEPPDTAGKIKVRACAWDYKERNRLYEIETNRLREVLEEVIELINLWMKE